MSSMFAPFRHWVETAAVQTAAGDQQAAATIGDFNAASGTAQAIALTVLVLLGVLIPVAFILLSRFLHGRVHNAPAKDAPYECGLSAVVGGADERFSVKFYLIAMLFLVFDLEVAFLFPWAVQFADGGWGMVWVLVVFLLMLEAGYLYLYRKGALDWER